MSRISELEFYNDKDVITQIEWLKKNVQAAVIEDIQMTENPSAGTVTMTITFSDGTTMSRSFATTAVTGITGSQQGNQLTLTFHLANGQTYDVTFTVTVTATTAWSALTGQPSDNASLTARINALAQAKVDDEETRAVAAELLITNSLSELDGTVTEMATTLTNILYPVGSLYLTTNSTNPGTFLTGTTWEEFGKGRMLMSVPSGRSAGATGGSYSHTITVEEMPEHQHTIGSSGKHVHGGTTNDGGKGSVSNIAALGSSAPATADSFSWADDATWKYGGDSTERHTGTLKANDHTHSFVTDEAGTHTHTCGKAGEGTAIDITNQYITCYVFKRTA